MIIIWYIVQICINDMCVYIKCIIEMFIRIDFKKILWVFVVCYEYFILIDNYLIIFTHYHFFCFVFCFYYLSLFCCFVFLFLFCLFCFCLFCFLFTFVCVCTLGNPGKDFFLGGKLLARIESFFLVDKPDVRLFSVDKSCG